MGLRLFVAIELPEVVLDALRGIQDQLKGRAGAELVRWVEPEGIHLTVKFLGDTREELLPQLEAGIGEACSGVGPIALRLGRAGAFPSPRRPRVIWVGLEPAEGDDSLSRLQERIEVFSERLGFRREERPFTPHLTLGRLREERTAGAASQAARLLAEPPEVPPLSFTAQGVSLMRSTLRPAGAVYTRVLRVPLAGPD